MCEIAWFFRNSERKKKPIHVKIVNKIHRLERAQYALLDHSKALDFSDVIKIEIIFKLKVDRLQIIVGAKKYICVVTVHQ